MSEQMTPTDSKMGEMESQMSERMMIMGIRQFMPDAPKFYPQLEMIITMILNGVDEYLGDNEKIVIATRRGGKTNIVAIDAKSDFKISKDSFEVEKDKVILAKNLKQFVDEKIYSNGIAKWMKEEYEEKYKGKTGEGSIMDLMSVIK